MRSKLLLPVILLMLYGCGGSSAPLADGQPPVADQATRVVGRVVLATPVVGAPLRLVAEDGTTLGSGTTGSGGFFELEIPQWSVPFAVEVQAGADRHLAARYEAFDPLRQMVEVNAATTLAVAFQHLHPELSQVQAEEEVRRYLGLPDGTTLGSHAANRDFGFDHRVFLARAGDQGGMDAFVASLAANLELQGRDDITGPFSSDGIEDDAEEAAESGFSLSDAGSSLLKGLGNGLLSFAGQAALGWACAELGLPLGNTQAFRAILEDLAEIKAELDDIYKEISQVIAALEDSLDDTLKNSLTDTLTFIDTNASFLEDGDALSLSEIESNLQTIGARSNMIAVIGETQLGSGGTGLIALRQQKVGDNGRFLSSTTVEQMQSELSYYQSYQLRALNLLIEAFHMQNPPELDSAAKLLDQFHVSAKAQQQMLPQFTLFIPPDFYYGEPIQITVPDDNLVLDLKTNLMWLRQVQAPMSYASAQLLASQVHDGFSGWRLPTPDEVKALSKDLDYVQNQVCLEGVDANTIVWTSATGPGPFGSTAVEAIRVADGQAELAFMGHDVSPQPSFALLLVRDLGTSPWHTDIVSLSFPVTQLQCIRTHYWTDPTSTLREPVEDVTDRVLWTAQATDCEVHISNAPDSSGQLTVKSLGDDPQVVITAQLGSTSISTTLTADMLPQPDTSLQSIVISPVRTVIDPANPAPFSLQVTASLANGETLLSEDHDLLSQTTFTTDHPELLSISPQGVVSILGLPAQETEVTVTGTYQGFSSVARIYFP